MVQLEIELPVGSRSVVFLSSVNFIPCLVKSAKPLLTLCDYLKTVPRGRTEARIHMRVQLLMECTSVAHQGRGKDQGMNEGLHQVGWWLVRAVECSTSVLCIIVYEGPSL